MIFIPKYRRKVLYGQLRRHLGEVFRRLARQKESEIEEGRMMADHVHMMISIPPKYSVAQVIGFIKGKSAIYIARHFGERRRNFVGHHFWARGYFVSTVGRDEGVIRRMGASFDSRKLGFSSTLAAVSVEQTLVDRAAEVIGAFPEVTHNYLRNDTFNIWFTMIAVDEERIEHVLEEIRTSLSLERSAVLNLPVKRLFKLDARFGVSRQS